MRVSCITPTWNRPDKHAQLLRVFRAQTHPEKELLVWDDSPSPSPTLQRAHAEDASVRYVHAPERLTIGDKRNRLTRMARGEVIAAFDDDDIYAPEYIERMLARLRASGASLVKLAVWIARRESDGSRWRWDTRACGESCYAVTGIGESRAEKPNADARFCERALLGYGFSYVYTRALGLDVPFKDMTMGEDFHFVREAQKAGHRVELVADGEEWVEHILHPRSMSAIFPQTRLSSAKVQTMVPLDPAKGDVAIIPGRVYKGDALVKDGHTEQDLRAKLEAFGVTLDEVTRRDSGRKGYSFMSFQATAGPDAGGMLPWRAPAPLSWIDDTHIVSLSVDAPVGMGQAETFHGIPDGFTIDRIVNNLADLPPALTPRRTGMGMCWESPSACVVQSRETGRLAVTVPRRIGAGAFSLGLPADSPFIGTSADQRWQEIAAQIQQEGGTTQGIDDTIAAAKSQFVNTLQGFVDSNAIGSATLADLATAAQNTTLVKNTALGAVNAVEGIAQGIAAGGAQGAQEIAAGLQSLIGIITATVAAVSGASAPETLGIGAAIGAAIELTVEILSVLGFFGSNDSGVKAGPGTCHGQGFTSPSKDPVGGMIGYGDEAGDGGAGVCVAGPLILPGSPHWRTFPEPSRSDDAPWFAPIQQMINFGMSTFNWSGAEWTAMAYVALRPIDCAFHRYRLLECELAQKYELPNGGGPGRSTANVGFFLQSYFHLWKKNQENQLNGLKAASDSDVLKELVDVWNRAHYNTGPGYEFFPAPSVWVGNNESPDCTQIGGGYSYVSMLLVDLINTSPEILSLASDGSGAQVLRIHTGDQIGGAHAMGGGLGGLLGRLRGGSAVVLAPSTTTTTTKLALVGGVLGGAVATAVGVALVQRLPWQTHLVAGWDSARAGAASLWRSSRKLVGASEAGERRRGRKKYRAKR